MNLDRGPELFARFAIPPNLLAYCGPLDDNALDEAFGGGDLDTVRRLALDFEGAMPYLRFIAAETGIADPLSLPVVAAYWLGTDLASWRDRSRFGTSILDRFSRRAPDGDNALAAGIASGRPTHAYHVFCVYPWVGLLRAGHTTQPLEVLEQCRVGWGRVVQAGVGHCQVEAPPLRYEPPLLTLGEPRPRMLDLPRWWTEPLTPGDLVAFHWNTVALHITPFTARQLERDTRHHLAIANQSGRGLATAIERAAG